MISGVILARNEEANIVACLEALRPHVGEILLIDMESEDRTVELARPLVEKVLTHPQVANFDAARNIAIPEARFDWFWFVDADERLSERTDPHIRASQVGEFKHLPNAPWVRRSDTRRARSRLGSVIRPTGNLGQLFSSPKPQGSCSVMR